MGQSMIQELPGQTTPLVTPQEHTVSPIPSHERLFSLKTHVGTASARQPSRATPPLREIYPYTRGRLYQPSASLPQNSVHLGYICLPNGLSSTNL